MTYSRSVIVRKILSNGMQQLFNGTILDAKTIVILCNHSESCSVLLQFGYSSKLRSKCTNISKDDRVAGGLPSSLTVSKGTRIMLIRNISTSHGLVNGAMGYVVYFDLAVDDPMHYNI